MVQTLPTEPSHQPLNRDLDAVHWALRVYILSSDFSDSGTHKVFDPTEETPVDNIHFSATVQQKKSPQIRYEGS